MIVAIFARFVEEKWVGETMWVVRRVWVGTQMVDVAQRKQETRRTRARQQEDERIRSKKQKKAM
jgi:hypothetical protein